MDIDIDLEGFRELEQQLLRLERAVAKKVLRKAAKKAAAPLAREMRAEIRAQGHVDTKLLSKSVRTKTFIPRSGNFADVAAEIGIKRNRAAQERAGRKLDPPVYAYWLEYGVEPHSIARSAKRARNHRQNQGVMHPGFAAKPFIRPVFDRSIEQILETEKTVLAEEIQRALNV